MGAGEAEFGLETNPPQPGDIHHSVVRDSSTQNNLKKQYSKWLSKTKKRGEVGAVGAKRQEETLTLTQRARSGCLKLKVAKAKQKSQKTGRKRWRQAR